MWDSGYLAPTSGIVTSVQIKVGPTTGAMEFVVLRSYYPGVPIPAYIVADAQVGTFPDFGFAPAPSAVGITAPSSELYHYNWDWNGYVVMMNATLDTEITSAPTPTPTPTPAPTPTMTPTNPALPVVRFPATGPLAVRGNKVRVPLDCTGAACQGTLLLQSARSVRTATALTSKRHHVARLTTYGSARFTVSAGKKVAVTITLNAAGRRLMRAHRRVTVFLNVTFTAGGGQPQSESLVLKR